MLTQKEVYNIFSWLPYREDWPVDRNQKDDNIDSFYGQLIKDFTQNKLFDTYHSEDGGLGNYLEFICYPGGLNSYAGNAIVVCVSLCSPVAAYGQTTFQKTSNSRGWGRLFSPDKIGVISDTALTEIEKVIRNLFTIHNLNLVDIEFASRALPDEVAARIKHENHNEGNQYLHGLFQKID